MSRRYLIPEVIQTAAADGGPAALKALFGGYGIYLSYDRLREACQPGTDGESIDTLGELARNLGMDITASVQAPEQWLLSDSDRLPAIVTLKLPDDSTQTVVVWRAFGPWLQVMDPSSGRLWVRRQTLAKMLSVQERTATALFWAEWSRSSAFAQGLQARMRQLGVRPQLWGDPGHQDAALRFGEALRGVQQLGPGRDAGDFLNLCASQPDEIPAQFWSTRDCSQAPGEIMLRGTTILTVNAPPTTTDRRPMSGTLLRVMTDPPPRIWQPVWDALRGSGWLLPSVAAFALCAAAFGTVMEALLFRGLFDIGGHLQSTAARLIAIAALLIFLLSLMALDWPAVLSSFRLGRRLELRLRTDFMLKVPKLSDSYFQSRLVSDMAFRAHWLQLLRQIPEAAGNGLHYVTSIVVTGIAIALVYPGTTLLTILAVLAACGLPLLFLPAMTERDLRYREISAALGSSYLDGLLGTRAIQAHCAERSLEIKQSSQLRQWALCGLRQQALFVRADAVQMALTLSLGAALIYREAAQTANPAGLLLLIYWATSLPLLGQELARLMRSLPAMRNTLIRFLEMLSSPDEPPYDNADAFNERRLRGVQIDLDNVTVRVGRHAILDQATLHVRPGEHVAIVGVSGAGKSSLVGCLLGWHQPSAGSVCADNQPLTAERLARLRRETAWIDPQVHLFRSTLYENLIYGNEALESSNIAAAVEVTELDKILTRLPEGLQTAIGNDGTLISGGEGQRIRAGRALARRKVRLAILDEPARGLGHEDRRRLLATARRHFANATLLCVTHDVADTLDFDRIAVVEKGRVLEFASPQTLRAHAGSRYNMLLERERTASRKLWSHPKWRRFQLDAGALNEERGLAELRTKRL